MEFFLGLLDIPSLLLVALVFVPLERLLPQRREQPVLRPGWAVDTVYFIINRIPISIGLLMVVALATAVGEKFIPSGFRATVAGQSLWLQAVELILVSDLLFYTLHRLFHTIPFLWRFHAVHHSIETLDWLAAHRIHPVDQILTKGAALVPCFAMGFSGEAILIFAIFYRWHTLFLHANLRIGFGRLHWLLASPCFHHWHHAAQPEAWNRNFAAQLPIWDLLFGTAYMRRDAMPARFGIEDRLPADYLAQMVYPFRRSAVRDAENLPDRAEVKGSLQV